MSTESGPRRQYPAVSNVVGAEHSARFATVLDADPTQGIPPTFAATYALADIIPMMLADTTLDIDVARMLHGEQSFVWTNHPNVGEVLTTTGQVTSDETRGGRRFVTLRTEVVGRDARPICVATTVMVVR
jgi:hypothetical protein